MGFLFTIVVGFLFTIVLGIQLTISIALLFGMSGIYKVSDRVCLDILANAEVEDLTTIRTLDLLGNTHKRRNSLKARRYFTEAERICRQFRRKHPGLYGRVLGNMGALSFEIGNFDTAISLLRRSNYWAKRANDMLLMAQNSSDLGIIYRSQGFPEKALEFYRPAEKIIQNMGELGQLARTLQNIGNALADLGRFKEAEEATVKSIYLKREQSADLVTLGSGLISLAEIRMQSNYNDEVFDLLQEAVSLATKAENNILRTRALYDMAEVMRVTGMPNALQVYKQAENSANSIKHWSKNQTRMKWIQGIRKNFSDAVQ